MPLARVKMPGNESTKTAQFSMRINTGAVTRCSCGAPFDIEQTPNLQPGLMEAGLSWRAIAPIREAAARRLREPIQP